MVGRQGRRHPRLPPRRLRHRWRRISDLTTSVPRPTSTIILAFRAHHELWCMTIGAWAEGSKGERAVRACRCPAISRTKYLASKGGFPGRARPRALGARVAVRLTGWIINEEGDEYENGILACGRDSSRAGKPCPGGGYDQDWFCLHVQRSDRRHRQRHAQLLRAC